VEIRRGQNRARKRIELLDKKEIRACFSFYEIYKKIIFGEIFSDVYLDTKDAENLRWISSYRFLMQNIYQQMERFLIIYPKMKKNSPKILKLNFYSFIFAV
jgi:hypothetical protein